MLRKGLVHRICNLFQDCPVSISTACSAEDALRAVESQPFDLVICDHQFNIDQTKLKEIPAKDIRERGRPSLFFDGRATSKKAFRNSFSEYFENERFTLQENDGKLVGEQALLQLIKTRDDRSLPTPVLILLSGHKIELPDSLGIVSAQKPLKQSEFSALLEAHGSNLIDAGRCVEHEETGSMTSLETSSSSVITLDAHTGISTSLVNGHGSQIFVQCHRGADL